MKTHVTLTHTLSCKSTQGMVILRGGHGSLTLLTFYLFKGREIGREEGGMGERGRESIHVKQYDKMLVCI